MSKHYKIECFVGDLHSLSFMVVRAIVTHLGNKKNLLNLCSMFMARDRHCTSLMQSSLQFNV